MSPGPPRPGTSVVRMSFMTFALLDSACGRGVGQQGNLAGVLDRGGDVPLMLGAVAGHPAGADLAAIRDEAAQQGGVLVVDRLRVFLAEGADLLLRLADGGLGHGIYLRVSEGVRKVKGLEGRFVRVPAGRAGRRSGAPRIVDRRTRAAAGATGP